MTTTEATRRYNDKSRARIAAGHTKGEELSPRERVVAALLKADFSIAQVAEQLDVTRGTVTQTMHRMYRKLGVTTREELQALRTPTPAAPRPTKKKCP